MPLLLFRADPDIMSDFNLDSNPNSNPDSNRFNSTNNSSNSSRSFSPYGDPLLHHHQHSTMDPNSRPEGFDQNQDSNRSSLFGQFDLTAPNGMARMVHPMTPACVYIVTSDFSSQTMPDGIRLSESNIVGFQILGVFARLEDANSYAEHEFEEIDAGVRARRRGRQRSRAAPTGEEEGVSYETSMDDNGARAWIIGTAGKIEVGQWVVQ